MLLSFKHVYKIVNFTIQNFLRNTSDCKLFSGIQLLQMTFVVRVYKHSYKVIPQRTTTDGNLNLVRNIREKLPKLLIYEKFKKLN